MGEYTLQFISTDPFWMPGQDSDVDGAVALLVSEVAMHPGVSAIKSDEVEFHVSGEDFSHVACPRCGDPLHERDWEEERESQWLQWMERAFATSPVKLAVETPCCGLSTSLNDLHYYWYSAGFCMWRIEVLEHDVPNIPKGLIDRLEAMLKTTMKVVRVRV